MSQDLLFYQLFEKESSTYTYLLADAETKEAIIIDPVLETFERDLKLISELGLNLRYALDTHIHADHITSAGLFRDKLKIKICISKNSGADCADLLLEDQQKIQFGKHTITAIETPGHTNSCMTFLVGDKLFTGDALLVRGNGRTDFQEGSADKLYDSIHKLFNLGTNFTVYPAHDYHGQTKTTIELEKTFNPRLRFGATKAEFIQKMSELKLSKPKKMIEAVAANTLCGKTQLASFEAASSTQENSVTVKKLGTSL